MNQIYISKEFFDLIKKLASIEKVTAGVIFKGKDSEGNYTGKYYFNIPSKKTLIHVYATENDLKFEGDKIQISSVKDFIRFAELTGFPNCTINDVEEVSIRGHKYHNIVFKGQSKEARLPVADITCFVDPNHFKICCTRDSDPMRYVAKIGYTTESIDAFVKDIKDVPGCDVISIDIEGDTCKMLLRGKGNQQITSTLDEHAFYVNNDTWLADAYADKNKLRLFPTVMFRLLAGIGTDSEVEIRHAKDTVNDIIALKGYCVKKGALIKPEQNEATPVEGAQQETSPAQQVTEQVQPVVEPVQPVVTEAPTTKRSSKKKQKEEPKDEGPRSDINIAILCIESSSSVATNIDYIL